MPLIIDMNPPEFTLPKLESFIIEAVMLTDLIAIIDSGKWPLSANDRQIQNIDKYLPHIAFHLNPDAPEIPKEVLDKTRLVEIPDNSDALNRITELKKIYPGIIVSVRVNLDSRGVDRAIDLADSGAEVIHVVADFNGDEIGVEPPKIYKRYDP